MFVTDNSPPIPAAKEPLIRSISRALNVLQAINCHGSLTMTQISKAVRLPYPTAWRVVYTLVKEGVIEREDSRKYYRPTALSQSLSCGYRERVRLVEIAQKHIVKLTKEIGWPVAIASRVGPVMVVRDTTNELTALTFSDYHQGYSLPIAASASGLVCLAFSSEEQRTEIIDLIKRNAFDGENLNENRSLEGRYLAGIVEDGYASSIFNPYTKDPGKTSSIAVPLYSDGMVVGALALTFFSSALGVAEAYAKFKEPISRAQANIIRDLAEVGSFESDGSNLRKG